MSEKAILFVCLGNICRSTMAEGVFRSLIKKEPYAGLDIRVDSCGTGAYHQGDTPDERTMATLEAHGINDYVHHARKLCSTDFDEFDYILAMDRDNLRDIKRIQRTKPESKAQVMLFGEFSGTGTSEAIADPYYGGPSGFTKAYEQTMRFSKNLLHEIFPNLKAGPTH